LEERKINVTELSGPLSQQRHTDEREEGEEDGDDEDNDNKESEGLIESLYSVT
jgi:hypothetical protein